MLDPRPSRTESRADARPGKRAAAFDLKGAMAPLNVLRLRATDLGLIERQLRVKIAQMPQLFEDAPMLIDLGTLGDEASGLALGELAKVLRSCKVVPVAVSNASDELKARATEAGLGVLAQQPAGRAGREAAPAEPAPVAAPAPVVEAAPAPSPVAAHSGPVVVNTPVRGGQVIHARNNDLVVLAPVNPGAQVLADGHVHIYAPLRGRAVAGASGLLSARIFCHKLEAELVAISGAYVMADEIPVDRRGKPATVYLDNGECRIGAL
jgi:septum site-determining protein MinC